MRDPEQDLLASEDYFQDLSSVPNKCGCSFDPTPHQVDWGWFCPLAACLMIYDGSIADTKFIQVPPMSTPVLSKSYRDVYIEALLLLYFDFHTYRAILCFILFWFLQQGERTSHGRTSCRRFPAWATAEAFDRVWWCKCCEDNHGQSINSFD